MSKLQKIVTELRGIHQDYKMNNSLNKIKNMLGQFELITTKLQSTVGTLESKISKMETFTKG